MTDLQVVQYGTECVSISDKADLAVNKQVTSSIDEQLDQHDHDDMSRKVM